MSNVARAAHPPLCWRFAPPSSQGKTLSQIALNWVVCKGAVPIPGVKNVRQAQEVAGARCRSNCLPLAPWDHCYACLERRSIFNTRLPAAAALVCSFWAEVLCSSFRQFGQLSTIGTWRFN